MVTRILPIRIRAPLFSGFFRPTVAPEVDGAQRRGAQQEEPHNRRGSEREETTPNRGRGGSRLGAGDSRETLDGERKNREGHERRNFSVLCLARSVGFHCGAAPPATPFFNPCRVFVPLAISFCSAGLKVRRNSDGIFRYIGSHFDGGHDFVLDECRNSDDPPVRLLVENYARPTKRA